MCAECAMALHTCRKSQAVHSKLKTNRQMKTWLLQNKFVLVITAIVLIGTSVAVSHFRKPGQLDVIGAQAMDMSQMRPPQGAAIVQFATVRTGSISDTVTYTGTIKAYNEQDISPRITGTI